MLKCLLSAWDCAYKDFLIASPWVLAQHLYRWHLCGGRGIYMLIKEEDLSMCESASELL